MNAIGFYRFAVCQLFASISRSLSDDEVPTNEQTTNVNVMFSTPVSSLKAPRNQIMKLKSTRFQLPSSTEKNYKKDDTGDFTPTYVHVNCVACDKMVSSIQFRFAGARNVADQLCDAAERRDAENEADAVPDTEVSATRREGIE